MNKRIFGSLLCCALALSASAQISSTLSPYSQFGMGILSEQSQGFNRGMGGVGIGMRGDKIVNMLNPASYSGVDSLTMLFDAGVSGMITNFKEGGKRVNGKTGTFDYAMMSFRLMKNVGLTAGIMPYSNIGYDYTVTDVIDSNNTKSTEVHDGEGGFSQVFLGAGWQLFKGFSLGFNFSYFWGDWDRGVTKTVNITGAKTLDRTYSVSVSSYKLDLGLQYQRPIDADNLLTVGATYSYGHSLRAQANLSTMSIDTSSDVMTSKDSVPDALSLPHTFGVGLSLVHKKSLTVGLDYSFQKWSSLSFPMFNEAASRYQLRDDVFKDRHKVAVGLDWIPNPQGRKSILQHIHYRLGGSYATPYYNMGSNKGPGEMTVSAGLGIPLSRSMLNISGQWVHSSSTNFVTENSFRLSIGLTFNERWFAKWKVD